MFGFVHPTLRFAYHFLIVAESVVELVLKLTIGTVELIDYFHFSCSKLLPPFFEFILDLLLYLHLSFFEKSIMFVIHLGGP
jgi:hypothetical protein